MEVTRYDEMWEYLDNTYNMLWNRRFDMYPVEKPEHRQYSTCRVRDTLYEETDVYYWGGSWNCYDDNEAYGVPPYVKAATLFEDELKWDMEYFSYQYLNLLNFYLLFCSYKT